MTFHTEDLPILVAVPFSTKWTDRFALELAMHLEGSGDTIPILLEEHRLGVEDLEVFFKDPLFKQRVEKYQEQLRERGLSFKMKAQVQAEMLLSTSWKLIHDPNTSPAVKADQIRWTAKMAGFEPTKDIGPGDGGVTINIHMGDPALAPPSGVKVIDHE